VAPGTGPTLIFAGNRKSYSLVLVFFMASKKKVSKRLLTGMIKIALPLKSLRCFFVGILHSAIVKQPD
jgi:hypothetical protein